MDGKALLKEKEMNIYYVMLTWEKYSSIERSLAIVAFLLKRGIYEFIEQDHFLI